MENSWPIMDDGRGCLAKSFHGQGDNVCFVILLPLTSAYQPLCPCALPTGPRGYLQVPISLPKVAFRQCCLPCCRSWWTLSRNSVRTDIRRARLEEVVNKGGRRGRMKTRRAKKMQRGDERWHDPRGKERDGYTANIRTRKEHILMAEETAIGGCLEGRSHCG